MVPDLKNVTKKTAPSFIFVILLMEYICNSESAGYIEDILYLLIKHRWKSDLIKGSNQPNAMSVAHSHMGNDLTQQDEQWI